MADNPPVVPTEPVPMPAMDDPHAAKWTNWQGVEIGQPPKYLIESLEHAGEERAVFKGTEIATTLPVAIKLNRAVMACVDRDAREYRTLQELLHGWNVDSVVIVKDSGDRLSDDAGRPEVHYLVTEWLDGANIRKLLIGNALAPGGPWRSNLPEIMRGMVAGAVACHENGIAHRDFKPDNWMVAVKGEHTRVKLLDAGLAKSVKKPTGVPTQVLSDGSVGQPIIGTPFYQPPETWDAKNDALRGDLYGIGLSLLEVAAGQAYGQERLSTEGDVRELERVAREVGDVPEAVLRAILKAVNRNPAQRQKDATELLDELQKEFGVEPAPPSLAGSARWLLAISATVILAFLGWSARVVFSPSTRDHPAVVATNEKRAQQPQAQPQAPPIAPERVGRRPGGTPISTETSLPPERTPSPAGDQSTSVEAPKWVVAGGSLLRYHAAERLGIACAGGAAIATLGTWPGARRRDVECPADGAGWATLTSQALGIPTEALSSVREYCLLLSINAHQEALDAIANIHRVRSADTVGVRVRQSAFGSSLEWMDRRGVTVCP